MKMNPIKETNLSLNVLIVSHLNPLRSSFNMRDFGYLPHFLSLIFCLTLSTVNMAAPPIGCLTGCLQILNSGEKVLSVKKISRCERGVSTGKGWTGMDSAKHSRFFLLFTAIWWASVELSGSKWSSLLTSWTELFGLRLRLQTSWN